jgi:tetratricopeptide (TPR) repeat protein
MPSSLPLAGERVAFTGTLASMTHREAAELVVQQGGAASEHVSGKTTLLVVGEEGWPLEADGLPSVKLRQALKHRQEGGDVRVLTESDWLSVLGLSSSHEEPQRVYTPAMLSQSLGIPVSRIRRWNRLGLIRAVRVVYRLPYFDFREVAAVRRLAELVDAGVDAAEIATGLRSLHTLYPDLERPLAQLDLLARDRQLVHRDRAGRLMTADGQRLIDFEPVAVPADAPVVLQFPASPPACVTADEWLARALTAAEGGDFEGAVADAREAIRLEPSRSDLHRNLAELQYRAGDIAAATERLRVALDFDRADLEAWTQLGCLLAEGDRTAEALSAFDAALAIHAELPEAHFHKAELLHRLGRTAEGVPHWETYLRFDQRGPWGELARRRLEG